MQIGNLQIKDHLVQKPLSITPGGKFITAEEILAQPVLGLGSLFTLDDNLQVELAVERYGFEPELRLGVIGAGVYTRDEIVAELKAQTPFGREVLRAEMYYCNILTASLLAGDSAPKWPDVPRPIEPTFPDWKKVKRCIWLKITNRVIFCENTTDRVTTPFANYRVAHVHPAFQARGFNVVALTGPDDVRNIFVPQAKEALAVYVGGVGHGSYNCYTGHMGDHILESGNYDSVEVQRKSFHLLSCQTGAGLGPDTVANGASSYAGYTENFTLVWDDGTTPAVNEFELFARSDSTYDLSMAAGLTAQQAFDSTIVAFNAAMAQVPNSAAATFLLWDRDHLKLYGDPAGKLVPYRWVRFCYPLPWLQESQLVELGELRN
jgi:hypothetical protein